MKRLLLVLLMILLILKMSPTSLAGMFKGKFLHGNLKNENTACDYFKGHVNENFNYFLYNKIHYFCILLRNSYLYSDIGFNNHYGVFSKLAFY